MDFNTNDKSYRERLEQLYGNNDDRKVLYFTELTPQKHNSTIDIWVEPTIQAVELDDMFLILVDFGSIRYNNVRVEVERYIINVLGEFKIPVPFQTKTFLFETHHIGYETYNFVTRILLPERVKRQVVRGEFKQVLELMIPKKF